MTLALRPPPAPDSTLIRGLEQLLEEARAGRVRGLVALVDEGTTLGTYTLGEVIFGRVLLSFEDWKFEELTQRAANAYHKDFR